MSITRLTTNGLTGTKYDTVSADNYYMEPIATTLVGAGGSATVTFSNIPQNYKHLQIRLLGRSAYAGSDEALRMQFNGVSSTSSYSDHLVYGNGASALTDFDVQTVAGLNIHRLPAATSTASVFGGLVIDLLDYSNVYKFKTLRSLGGFDANGSGRIVLNSGLFGNTAPITSITITLSTASNFAQYSRFSLFGIKG
jgi:hypothetical protein